MSNYYEKDYFGMGDELDDLQAQQLAPAEMPRPSSGIFSYLFGNSASSTATNAITGADAGAVSSATSSMQNAGTAFITGADTGGLLGGLKNAARKLNVAARSVIAPSKPVGTSIFDKEVAGFPLPVLAAVGGVVGYLVWKKHKKRR